jgi:hypothetical protein
MRWLREYRTMRRARFTRAERQAFRAAVDADAGELTCAQVRLIMRYYLAVASRGNPAAMALFSVAYEHMRALEGRDAA